MRKLLLSLFVVLSSIAHAQVESTFIMTSAKNEVCKRTSTKWVTINRTYDDIEIEVIDGIIYLDTKRSSTYTPIEKSTIKYMDGYEIFSVLCKDKNYNKCVFSILKDDEGDVFLCTVEYNDYKYFYYKYR
jgi:hypothetical protein